MRGGGLLTEPDVDAQRGQVPVAGLGLQFGGAAALGGEVSQPGVAQLVQGVPGAVRVVELGRLLEQVLGARVGQPAAATRNLLQAELDRLVWRPRCEERCQRCGEVAGREQLRSRITSDLRELPP